MKIRIGTWNIAAARKMMSTARFDYSEGEELDYFAAQLSALNLDVICLQESHLNDHDSLAQRLAHKLGMPSVAETAGCPSHIDPTYKLTTAILARSPFKTQTAILLPQPAFELTYKGKRVPPYDRYAQIATFDAFTVATLHTEPLESFGARYDTEPGKSLSRAIDTLLAGTLTQPLLLAADFNADALTDMIPRTLDTFQLQESLPKRPTKPHGGHPDHLLRSPEWRVHHAEIVQTQSDHYLCWGEFDLDIKS